AFNSAQSGNACGKVPLGLVASFSAMLTKRLLRRLSPSSVNANSVCAHWAGGSKVVLITCQCEQVEQKYNGKLLADSNLRQTVPVNGFKQFPRYFQSLEILTPQRKDVGNAKAFKVGFCVQTPRR